MEETVEVDDDCNGNGDGNDKLTSVKEAVAAMSASRQKCGSIIYRKYVRTNQTCFYAFSSTCYFGTAP